MCFGCWLPEAARCTLLATRRSQEIQRALYVVLDVAAAAAKGKTPRMQSLSDCNNFYERRRARVSLRNPSRGYLEFKNFQIIFRMRLSTQNIKIIAEYISLSIYSIHKKNMVTYETTSDQFS